MSAKIYMTQDEFLNKFRVASLDVNQSEIKISLKTLWLNKDIQSKITNILNHRYPKLRLRYHIVEGKLNPLDVSTVWFLEEIGKERPISFGIAIKNNQIFSIQVLEFRESRGYEISFSGFSKQFETAQLNSKTKLNKNIDGITGATMSVNAMKKISRVALLLHAYVKKN